MEVSSSIIKKLQATIPEDVIIEFLSRLPVKTLLRFKVVCKTWYNFIKSHKFKLMHHNFCTVSQLLMCKRFQDGFKNHVFSFRSNDELMSESSPDLEVHANHRNGYIRVIGSCNGIVCYHDFSSIFLCNPATREFKQLPPNSFRVTSFCDRKQAIGFGFDSSNIYDFKVLRVFCEVGTHKDEIARAEIFTLSSNNWRQLDWGLNNELEFIDGTGLFCTNSFHFIMKEPLEHYVKNIITCCDVRTERFQMMDFPPKPKCDYRSFENLREFKGCLSSVYTFPCRPCLMNLEEKPIEIWVMKDYGVVESWIILYTIDRCWSLPVCFYRNEDYLLLVQYNNSIKLVSCNLSTLDVRSIEIRGYRSYSQVIVHKETLISIM